MTAEPKMEELLASIRKAIQDDIESRPQTGSDEGGDAAFRGAMRNIRARLGEEHQRNESDEEHIRRRIQRSRSRDEITRVRPADSTAPPARPAGFAGILGGGSAPAEAPPVLRPSYDQEESLHYRTQDHETAYGAAGDDDRETQYPEQYDEQPARPQIMSEQTSAAANAAFDRLADALRRSAGERTVEEMAMGMLRDMLKQWLDDNLPTVVERLVREEIERVTRR